MEIVMGFRKWLNEGRNDATKLKCLECGHKFKKKLSAKALETKCPKCGGYDTEID